MTPLELQIAIHYYAHASDFRYGDFDDPAVREAIDLFLRLGLIQPTQDHGRRGGNAAYCSTQRLQVFVHHLTLQPLPEQVWVMPKEEQP